MRLKRIISLLLALALLPLGGCGNSTEINSLSFVMGIGIDCGEGEDEYEVTTQIAKISALDPTTSSTDAGGKESKNYINITRAGLGIQAPLREISRLLNRELYTAHDQIIVIGSGLAERGLAGVLDYFVRKLDGRFTTSLVVARPGVLEVLDSASGLESLPAAYLASLIETRADECDVSVATIISFLIDMLGSGAPVIPIVDFADSGTGEEDARQLVLCGMAVFKDASMRGELTPDETRAMLAIRGELREGYYMCQAFDGFVNLHLIKSDSKIRPEYQDGKFKITVDISQEYYIADTTARADLLSIDTRDELAEIVRRDFTELLRATVTKMREGSLDVFDFGEAIRREHPAKSRELIESWDEEFPRLEVEFNVDVTITNTGAILKSIPTS